MVATRKPKQGSDGMDLLSIVVQPTWREFLLDLVQKNQLNPWDIDLVKVADGYLQRVRELQSLDLRIPANIILASAILLRFKADALKFEEEAVVEVPRELIQEEFPELVPRLGMPRRRKVTLHELISAINSVMKEGRKASVRLISPRALSISLTRQDINLRIQEVFKKAMALRDSENMVLFSHLLEERSRSQITYHLIPVLHLAQAHKVEAWQDEFFGEIFIRITDNGNGVKQVPEVLAAPAGN
jgi:segregation and condensation protein A